MDIISTLNQNTIEQDVIIAVLSTLGTHMQTHLEFFPIPLGELFFMMFVFDRILIFQSQS
jgi:hypothetical protein